MTLREIPAAERMAFLALAGALSLIQITNFGGEVLLAVSALLWIVIAVRDRARPAVPAFFLPLLALAAWTFVSTFASPSPLESLREDKQLLWYLVVPITMRVARGARATTVANAIIAVGSVSALVGIGQGVIVGGLDFDYLMHHRPHGLLGHFMTYSGMLMLVVTAAAAQLIYREREWVWPAVAVPALLVALAVTLSRNAWVGAVLGLAVLLMLRRPKLVIVLPVLVTAAMLVGPVRDRAKSMFDPENVTNRDRVSMLKSGVAMIRDHWLVGVGPNMVPKVYLERYKRADAIDPEDRPGSTRAHLHNVIVQLAAERGVPALVAWLWFVVVAARDLVRQTRTGPARALAAGGLAAIVAMLAAGLFEHNFGDSEFLVLFLGLVTLPFAARLGSQSPDALVSVAAHRPDPPRHLHAYAE